MSSAPKGGSARLIALGTFDNFNMVTGGVKGSLAAGIDQLYDTLMVAALDEESHASTACSPKPSAIRTIIPR